MADSANTQLQDHVIARRLLYLRLASRENLTAQQDLTVLERRLTTLLMDPDIDPTEVRRQIYQDARAEKFSVEATAIIAAAFVGMRRSLTRNLVRSAVLESGVITSAINDVMGFAAMRRGFDRDVATDLVARSLISIRAGESLPIEKWFRKQAIDFSIALDGTVKLGLGQGLLVTDIVRSIRGTQSRQFKDGLMARIRRHLETLVRSTVLGVDNAARLETFQNNPDIVKGIAAVVTLDSRTSTICLSRARAAWSLDGKPLRPDMPQIRFPGPPPWHGHCRTVLSPILFNHRTLQRRARSTRNRRELAEMRRDNRALFDGELPFDISLDEAAKRLGDQTMREALGRRRFDMWKSGKIDLHRLIDNRGRPLTIADLERLP